MGCRGVLGLTCGAQSTPGGLPCGSGEGGTPAQGHCRGSGYGREGGKRLKLPNAPKCLKIVQGLVVQKGEPSSSGERADVRAGTQRALQLSHVTAAGLFKGLIYVFIYHKGHVFAIEGRARSKQQAAICLPASCALLLLRWSCCQQSQAPALAKGRVSVPLPLPVLYL